MLRPERVRVPREIAVAAVVRESQKEGRQGGAVAGSATDVVLLPGPLAAEIESPLVPDTLISLLEDPVLSAVLECHVALHLRQDCGPGVVRGIDNAPCLIYADIAEEP